MHASPRRPRTAFVTPTAPLVLRRHSFFHTPRCSASNPSPSPPTSHPNPDSSASSDRARVVQKRLEFTRTRVRLLNSRVIVRVGSAGIRLAESLLSASIQSSHDPSLVDTDAATIDRLRHDLRSLRRLCAEHPADHQAAAVVAQLDQVVDAVSSKLAEGPSIDVAGAAHEDVEDELEGSVQVVEDSQWQAVPLADRVDDDDQGVVQVVKRKVVEHGDALKRRASSVGAGIEDKVAEFVKDDGSIDVEGLRTLVGGLLDNASMTWKRLNGQPTREAASGEATDVVYESLSVQDPEKEFRLREEIGDLEKRLIDSSKEREAVLRKEDQLGRLIRAKEIRLMDDGVSALRRTLAVRVLQLEMEKIFSSVADEIENSDAQIMMEQRVLVVEFGDLDERLATLELYIEQEEPLLIEDDVLGELAADIQDLKTRLGLDAPLYSSATLSWPQVRQFFASTSLKTREGMEFYSRGLRLFAGDMRFAMRLIRRAVLGYTPSPREIRTIRRTGRDLLTLVPFTIVLIAPLTPVGHVLIFGFLQRYWPEFFPSTFNERRQAVMKRHEQYAKSLEGESNGEQNGLSSADDEGPQRKGGGGGGRLAALRKLLFFGVMAGEAAEEGEVDENGSGEKVIGSRGVATGEGNPSSGNTNGAVKDETEDGNDGDAHPVALSDLAESAQDSEKVAQKKRIAMALDELHLAD